MALYIKNILKFITWNRIFDCKEINVFGFEEKFFIVCAYEGMFSLTFYPLKLNWAKHMWWVSFEELLIFILKKKCVLYFRLKIYPLQIIKLNMKQSIVKCRYYFAMI